MSAATSDPPPTHARLSRNRFGRLQPVPLARQRRALALAGLCALLPASMLLAALLVVTRWKGLPFDLISSDPATIGSFPFYAGFMSNVGVLLWCAAAAVSLFAGTLLWNMLGNRRIATFLVASGLFTAVLLADDLFLVHDVVCPDYLGVPQPFVVATYGVLALAGLSLFAPVVAQTNYTVLLLATLLLGASAAIDQLTQLPLTWEDGAKMLGIAAWCAYFVQTSAAALQSAVSGPPHHLPSSRG